jgi:outer membrane lipoprotein-sorting protein
MKTLSLFLTLAMPFFSIGQSAKEIVQKAHDKLQGANTKGEMTMSIIRPSWSRDISMKSWSMGSEYSMIFITQPARDEGTVFLKREKEIYNWVPSIERTIKLPPSMMMQSWMGSDFTNDDLVQESSIVEDYTHTLDGEMNINGRDCWKVILTPKPEAAVVWGKIITYISKEEYLQLRSEFYDEDDELINVMKGMDVREIGGRILPTRLEMIPVNEEGKKTVLIYHNMEFDVDTPESFFTSQNMKRLR